MYNYGKNKIATNRNIMNHRQLQQFRTIFLSHYPDLVKAARFYVRDQAVADDIVQDTFAKLWENFDQTEHIENIKGYLQYTIRNRSLNHLEHLQVVDKYQQDYLKQLQEDEHTPDDFLKLVQNLVNQLPPKRKQILEMSIVESKSYQEIATQLDISLNTVKDHIKKAYAFLREEAHKQIPHYILFLAFHCPKV